MKRNKADRQISQLGNLGTSLALPRVGYERSFTIFNEKISSSAGGT